MFKVLWRNRRVHNWEQSEAGKGSKETWTDMNSWRRAESQMGEGCNQTNKQTSSKSEDGWRVYLGFEEGSSVHCAGYMASLAHGVRWWWRGSSSLATQRNAYVTEHHRIASLSLLARFTCRGKYSGSAIPPAFDYWPELNFFRPWSSALRIWGRGSISGPWSTRRFRALSGRTTPWSGRGTSPCHRLCYIF